ncbi:hypothetical protein V6N12_010571 [Hibiscus sabdariffa]|uniref:Uncharacterized protein n=1 Tax=Hibiscus sabdariffa TaxID=183260 RepID=A0ABR2EKG7_9ROSI
MSSRGLKLAVPPEMQQNPCLELDNGGPRVLCPKGIREYSLHVGNISAGHAKWAAKYHVALSFLHFCLFCAPECCSISATMGVPSREETAGSKVHV